MKNHMFKDELMISLFFMLLILTLFFLVIDIFYKDNILFIIFIISLSCLSLLTIFIRRVFQKVYITEYGIESKFMNKVFNKILWEDITNIEYSYGRSPMIVISLNNGKTFIIMSIFSNKIKFKQSLYKSIPKSFYDIKINLILSIGSFKSRFLKRMKIYNFLNNRNFIDDLEFLKIDSEDKEYIKTLYKDNLSEIRLLIKKHYGINFEI